MCTNEQNNKIKIILYLILFTCLCIFPVCDRVDMYDIASQKSRTAYAIVSDGVTYTLIIYNENYIKQFTVDSSFTNQPEGISVNAIKKVIAFDNSSYTAFTQTDLVHWINLSTYPSNKNVIGLHNDYIYLTVTALMHLNSTTYMWENLMAASSNAIGIFPGYDGEIYLLDINSGISMTFYKVSDSTLIQITNPITPPPLTGSYLNGYKTDSSFYFWYTGSQNSIFVVQDNTWINYNSNTPIDNGIIDVAVTDNNKIYALSFNTSGIDYYLYYIEQPGSYSQILYIGHNTSVTYFNMEALDNNHIIIATYGLSSGYNGLFIYNTKKNKVEKIITTKDVFALYVPR